MSSIWVLNLSFDHGTLAHVKGEWSVRKGQFEYISRKKNQLKSIKFCSSTASSYHHISFHLPSSAGFAQTSPPQFFQATRRMRVWALFLTSCDGGGTYLAYKKHPKNQATAAVFQACWRIRTFCTWLSRLNPGPANLERPPASVWICFRRSCRSCSFFFNASLIGKGWPAAMFFCCLWDYEIGNCSKHVLRQNHINWSQRIRGSDHMCWTPWWQWGTVSDPSFFWKTIKVAVAPMIQKPVSPCFTYSPWFGDYQRLPSAPAQTSEWPLVTRSSYSK